VDEKNGSEFRELRWLADMYEQTQRMRIAATNRARSILQGRDMADASQAKFLEDLARQYQDIENDIVKRMAKAVKEHPVYPWLNNVKGIGPTLAAKLLGLIPDIESFTTVSKLWRYCGLAVVNGKAERPIRGERLRYNPRLKTTMYLVASAFLRANSPYRRVYDEARSYYEATRPDWTKAHVHNAALRKMEKVFLAHLWEAWREAEGLPVRALYVHEKLGHEMLYRREDFC
jgi:hypothetical protein